MTEDWHNEESTRGGDPGSGAVPTRIEVGGEAAWLHDEGFDAGYFHTFDELRLGGDSGGRKVHVLLPRSYATAGKAYPVVFMQDGNTSFWPGGMANKSWRVAQRLAELYASDSIPEVIVVAVHPRERDWEYTLTQWASGRPYGGLPVYARYLADELKPFVDAHYRTRVGPRNAAVVGSSHGGLAAFHVATARPDRFGLAGAMSSSFWGGVEGGRGDTPLADSPLVRAARQGLSNAAIRPRIWMDWGMIRTGGAHNWDIEARAAIRGPEMGELLEREFGYARGVDLFTLEDPEGEHDEDSWGRRLPMVLSALLSDARG